MNLKTPRISPKIQKVLKLRHFLLLVFEIAKHKQNGSVTCFNTRKSQRTEFVMYKVQRKCIRRRM